MYSRGQMENGPMQCLAIPWLQVPWPGRRLGIATISMADPPITTTARSYNYTGPHWRPPVPAAPLMDHPPLRGVFEFRRAGMTARPN